MNCLKCGNEIPVGNRSVKYCSPHCGVLYLKAQYKKRNKEKVLAYNRFYRSLGYRHPNADWKNKVKENFKNKCTRCGAEKDLEVHHIVPLRFGGVNKPNNVLVLCKRCHSDWESRLVGYWGKIGGDYGNTQK